MKGLALVLLLPVQGRMPRVGEPFPLQSFPLLGSGKTASLKGFRGRKVLPLRPVGLIQEQHAERCCLFMPWKGMGWPGLVDALNRSGVHAVPLVWAIDEAGRPGRRLLPRPGSASAAP